MNPFNFPNRIDKIKFAGNVVFWILFTGCELFILHAVNGSLEAPHIYITYYAINISFFYLHVRILELVFYSKNKRYIVGIACYLLLLCFYMLAKATADQILYNQQLPTHDPVIYIADFVSRNVARAYYFGILATFYWFVGYLSYAKQQKSEAEKRQLSSEKDKAELVALLERSRNAYLQQQINPHMLFNALNFVFNTVQQHSDDAAQCIWLLSEVMRFSLEETGPDGKIPVEKELEQVDNLISINRYRFSEPLFLKISITGDFGTLRIIPLILMTLVENVFKHGDLTDGMQPALLEIKADPPGYLTFFSRNLKKSKNARSGRQQLGLQNTRVRLDSAYPQNYQLIIAEPGDHYELTLIINLCN